MRFVHAADLHLDSPLRGLDRYESAPADRIRGATRRALENLVELCLEEDAKLLLIAGDLYDGEWKDHSTGLFLVKQLARLREAGIQVVLVRGNHDASSRITKQLRYPDNVRELSTKKPETVEFETLGVAVHGQGFASGAVDQDLTLRYPAPIPGAFNIGLLHTSLDGREGHARYAPTSLEALVNRGYDYWALGHVHQREVLSAAPAVVFPGNLQGRHVRESGSKGVTLVTLRDGQVQDMEHRALDVVRWSSVLVDVSRAPDLDEVLERTRGKLLAELAAADGRLPAVRVTLAGSGPVHAALARDPEGLVNAVRLVGCELDDLWVEKVVVDTNPELDPEVLGRREDALGQVVRALQELRQGTPTLNDLVPEYAELRRKLPGDFDLEGARAGLGDEQLVQSLVDDAERLLLGWMLGGEA